MLWSQIIYGHRTASISPKIVYQFLDIVRCPVKFRYFLKFHSARTAFGRVNEGKMTSAGHHTVPGRCPAGVCTHRTGTGRFLFKIYIVGFQRCPYGHRPMFYESNCHQWEARCFCRRTYCIYIDISFLKTKNIHTNNLFRLSS